MLYTSLHGIKVSSSISSFHSESPGASSGALLVSLLGITTTTDAARMPIRSSRCAQKPDGCATARFKYPPLLARNTPQCRIRTHAAAETRELSTGWRDSRDSEPPGSKSRQGQSHASSGCREAEAAPCVGTGVLRRRSPGAACALEAPGLPPQREAPALRLRT